MDIFFFSPSVLYKQDSLRPFRYPYLCPAAMMPYTSELGQEFDRRHGNAPGWRFGSLGRRGIVSIDKLPTHHDDDRKCVLLGGARCRR